MRSERFLFIDGLRGLAALAVAGYHFYTGSLGGVGAMFVDLGVSKEPIPEALEEVEDHSFGTVQEADSQYITIEPVEKCA